MKKFTLVDYIIIILVICAIAFAFIHIATDDSDTVPKTSFDRSTIGKIPETYMNYYKDGYIVPATVEGFNASTGEEIEMEGTVIWVGDNRGSDVNILLENENGTFLLGTYSNNPNADVYIDKLVLEKSSEKYSNLVEIKLSGKNITSLKDLNSNIPNGTKYEITTKIALDSIKTNDIQNIENILNAHNKKLAIKTSEDNENQLIITRADGETINYADSVLGSFNGVSDVITIRIYNCSDEQLNAIKNSGEVLNIRKF